jgi:hypothetical protein
MCVCVCVCVHLYNAFLKSFKNEENFCPTLPLAVCLGEAKIDRGKVIFFLGRVSFSSRLVLLRLWWSSYTCSRLGNNNKNKENETEDRFDFTLNMRDSWRTAHCALGTAQCFKTLLISNMISYWKTRSSGLLCRLPDVSKEIAAFIFWVMSLWTDWTLNKAVVLSFETSGRCYPPKWHDSPKDRVSRQSHGWNLKSLFLYC